MIEYRFVEGSDFKPLKIERVQMEGSREVRQEDFTSVLSGTVVNNGAQRELQDYAVSVNMTKHVRMIQRLSSKLTKTQRVADPGAGVYFRASRRQFTLVNYLKIKRRFDQNLIESDTTR